MRAFFVVDGGYPLIADRIATMLNEMFREMELKATADWYYDEFVESGTEYGVRIEFRGMSSDAWANLKRSIEQRCEAKFGCRGRWEEAS